MEINFTTTVTVLDRDYLVEGTFGAYMQGEYERQTRYQPESYPEFVYEDFDWEAWDMDGNMVEDKALLDKIEDIVIAECDEDYCYNLFDEQCKKNDYEYAI